MKTPKTIKAKFGNIGIDISIETAKKVLNLQKIIREQRELNRQKQSYDNANRIGR